MTQLHYDQERLQALLPRLSSQAIGRFWFYVERRGPPRQRSGFTGGIFSITWREPFRFSETSKILGEIFGRTVDLNTAGGIS